MHLLIQTAFKINVCQITGYYLILELTIRLSVRIIRINRCPTLRVFPCILEYEKENVWKHGKTVNPDYFVSDAIRIGRNPVNWGNHKKIIIQNKQFCKISFFFFFFLFIKKVSFLKYKTKNIQCISNWWNTQIL